MPEYTPEQLAEKVAERKAAKVAREERRLANRHKIYKRTKEQQLKHSHFVAVEHYLQGKTKEQAMLKAGYTASTSSKAAWLVFDRDDVLRYIEKRQYKMRRRSHMMVDRIKEELGKVAFFNIGSFIEVDEGTGDFIYDFREATMDDFAALGEVSVESYKEGGKDGVVVKRIRVKPYGKLEALGTLCRIYGIMQDNVNITTDGGDSVEMRLAKGRKRLNKPEEPIEDAEYHVIPN